MAKRTEGKRAARAPKPKEPDWSQWPVTQAALSTPEGEQGPPPLQREWHQKLTRPGNFVLYWAGALRDVAGTASLSWGWMIADCGEPQGRPERAARGLPPPEDPDVAAKVECMLGPLAHEARVRIMQVLHEAPRSSSALSEATGLRGGNLYHHLKELIHAAYVREHEVGYALTDLGRQLLVTFACIAAKVVQDREGEGLVVGAEW
jgi:DNA-binding transcriptional ArsR family regulator